MCKCSIVFWRYGFWAWLGSKGFGLLGPLDRPLFSERNGYRRPLAKIGKWRFFVKKRRMT
jgi:hypothetical protein